MILVTGATGLVGAHLCLALLEENKTLVALYRREKKRDATRAFFESKNHKALNLPLNFLKNLPPEFLEPKD